ncbi:ATP-binding protein [Pararhizobium sp. IMCC21322]|uniref:sensor histidine kinase n=1 Tax=Pararhizobium sp. IMCC21322 TaxID=3067903 RepID=UPI002741ADAA|nr:ATP-binding protein [Pararhizobium sp. IMCC21322]
MSAQNRVALAPDSRLFGRKSIAIILIAMALGASALVFFVSQTYFRSLDQETAQSRLSLFERSLNETLSRFQHLPFVLARDATVREVLGGKPNTRLNRRLSAFAREAELEAIYLMDLSGLVISASNYDKTPSFLGKNYGFRPYFKAAAAGGRGNFFGVGATTGRPGYFVSEPVRAVDGSTIGIIAIKLDASELQKSWEEADEAVLATNADGIVVLASDRTWLYKTINHLEPQQLEAIRLSKQFGNVNVVPLSWKKEGPASVELLGNTYTLASTDAAFLDWKIHYLLNGARAYERTILATSIFGSLIALLMGFAAYLRSKRIQAALVASQSDRQELVHANRQLESAQAELARASKLAALGQLSASVVHELGQPISALRNYLTAEELSNDTASLPTLNKLVGVVSRMENITRQLRFFTKPGDEAFDVVTVEDVISDCLELTQHDIDFQNVDLTVDILTKNMGVKGNRLRLEQVLVNLVKNSLSSLQETAATKLSITAFESEGRAHIEVADNGSGFGARNLEIMQEPFHTTRASGDGMGLGLSISSAIISEHDGTLTAENIPEGGAKFRISLPLATHKSERIDGQ